MPHLTDLEELVLRCRNDASRDLIQEALSCYRAQAYRSCIVSTWIAVVYDFVGKLRDLSFMGDGNAHNQLVAFDVTCRTHNLQRSLAFERRILKMAKDDFEFLTELEYDELSRLLEDRHKCAHPSMHNSAEPYRPSAEAARYHLKNAVELFLQHPAAQGKAALDRLLRDLDGMFYPESLKDLLIHLEAGPLGQPRQSLLRNFVLVALKCLLAPEPAPAGAAPAEVLQHQLAQARREKRIPLTLAAVNRLHGELTLRVLDCLDQLLAAADDSRLPQALHFFGSLPEAWRSTGPAQQNRVIRFVEHMPVETLDPCLPLAWNLDFLRAAAEQRLTGLTTADCGHLGPGPFPKEWLDLAVSSLAASPNFDRSNAIIRAVLRPSLAQLSLADIDRIIQIASANSQVSRAHGFQELLYAATRPLGVDAIVDSLGVHNLLDSVRANVSWIPPVAEDPPIEGEVDSHE